MQKRRGRKAATDLVFETLQEAIAIECSPAFIPYEVNILGQRRFTMSSSSANAVRLTAYALGATAKPVSIRTVIKEIGGKI